MESNTEGNLLEIMDLARTLRQEQLFIQQEQANFYQLSETLKKNSEAITKLAYIYAQQRQNLNDLITSRPDCGPMICCRRANNYENVKFIEAKNVMDYEHKIAYEELFNHLYRSPYLLAMSLSTADRISSITPQHFSSVIRTITTGLYGNAINTKDVEMVLKLLRELIEIQIVISENPRAMLRVNSSAFARIYHCLSESLFSAKIFLTAALHNPIMTVLSDSETILDIDPDKVIQRFSIKERLKRFGTEDTIGYDENIANFHDETIARLYQLTKTFIDNLKLNWPLFPSSLRWLVQTMCHHLKQTHFTDKIINEIITDMIFTHFICPAIVSPDVVGIIDASISEEVRYNLIQIGKIIQIMALSKYDEIEPKFLSIYKKFKTNMVTQLIDLLLVTKTGEDVVAILSQQSDFERTHLLTTQNELIHFVEFFRILLENDSYDIAAEERQKLIKILGRLPELSVLSNGVEAGATESHSKEHRSKQSFMSLSKTSKSKIAKSITFNTANNNGNGSASGGAGTSNHHVIEYGPDGLAINSNSLSNGSIGLNSILDTSSRSIGSTGSAGSSSCHSSPVRNLPDPHANAGNEQILMFDIYIKDDNKLQPLTEEEVLKMNSIGGDEEIAHADEVLLADVESCNLENTIDKSSLANGYDGIDGMSDVLRPLHTKATRFSLSHDDASIGNSDNLEVVSEAPSNHSVTSSMELEENDQNDNLSDMVSANVSGRGTPNISGRDTPSSQVTDGESVHNAIPTPQMQKLISKARSDIDDKFCKFEIKKFQGDETVSIVSDTWSTDVLASDSETLDANERDRDRNFSTPLIPSSVILPGDNNFEALTSANTMRTGYLDVSDQRSESNWSTDVLASDSEKLAEIDTDDNVSITARSDTTDASGRQNVIRNLLNRRSAGQNAGGGERPSSNSRLGGGTSRNGSADNARDDLHSGGSSGGNASDRSQEDSAFYDAINPYVSMNYHHNASTLNGISYNAGGGGGGSSDGGIETADNANMQLTSTPSFHLYQGPSSLARSSVRTTNPFNGESNFQQNYKCGEAAAAVTSTTAIVAAAVAASSSSSPISHANHNHKCDNTNNHHDKDTFLGTPIMRRQMSAESSISNQSFTLDEPSTTSATAIASAATLGVKTFSTNNTKSHHHHYHYKSGMKKKRHNNILATANQTDQDLIDFSDFGEEKPSRRIQPAENGGEAAALIEIFSDEAVEHRPLSSDQRTTVFDGRRNGILAMQPNGLDNHNHSVPALRRHQSLNYENHEIMINNIVPKRNSAMPYLKNLLQNYDGHEGDAEGNGDGDGDRGGMNVGITIDDEHNENKNEEKELNSANAQNQDILLLCTKTSQLTMNDNNPMHVNFVGGDGGGGTTSSSSTTASSTLTTTITTTITMSSTMSPSSSMKPTKSTGAIPKSISFDATADKITNNPTNSSTTMGVRPMSQRNTNNNNNNNRVQMYAGSSSGMGSGTNSGIFNKLKQGIFKHRRNHNSKSTHGHANSTINTSDEYSASGRSVSFNTNTSEVSLDMISGSESSVTGVGVGNNGGSGGGSGGISRNVSGAQAMGYCDITEDILAKYRRKVSTSSETTNSDSTGGHDALASASRNANINNLMNRKDLLPKLNSSSLHDKVVSFNVIKKKIRSVLSKTDLHTGDFRHTTYSNCPPLLTYLQIQLAQSINLQNFQQISYVSEAIRCISILELNQHAQLLTELQKDIQKRQNYLQYLMRYRQNLLLIMENIEQFKNRIRSENAICNRNLMIICVRQLFEKRQTKFEEFQEEFSRLTVSDDKVVLIEEFIENFMDELVLNDVMLNDLQTREARFSIERILLQRIYQQVMFPNDDADLLRDSVLSEHIRKLQSIISPSHPALRIPQEYLAEAPWPFAQQQLSYISAYKTPREKFQCIIRCISSIITLLHMFSGRDASMDDLLPVVLYVFIMANPPFLLSTLEYIHCFIGKKVEGIEEFHWKLFCSVVDFIKTLDYFD